MNPGGPNAYGRRKKYCSDLCNQHANSWWRVYGITPEVYWKTLKKQDGVCAVCGSDKGSGNDRTFAVDHEHVDGYESLLPEQKGKYFRGLLCNICNIGRVAKNNVETAKKVVKYLEEHALKNTTQ